MAKAKVYVVQDATFYDPERKEYKSKFNLSSAQEHGDLVFLLPSGDLNNPQEVISVLQKKLGEYGMNDFILPIGSPDAIGWAVAIAANITDGYVNTLTWRRQARCYQVRRAQLW